MAASKLRRGHENADAWTPWEEEARGLVVQEMARRKIRYKELAYRLEAFGIHENAAQLNRKINRQKFSAALLLACMAALKVEWIAVPELEEAPDD